MKSLNTVFIGGSAGDESQNVTAASTANTVGSWFNFGSVSYPVNNLTLIVDDSGGNANFMVNVSVGASNFIIIPNLLTINSFNQQLPVFSITLPIPLIPPNTDFYVNAQSTTASVSNRVSLGVGWSESEDRISLVTSLGALTASTGLTAITSGSTANNYGPWYSIGTLSLSGKKALLYATRQVGSLSTAALGIGPSGSQVTLINNIPNIYSSSPLWLKGNFPPGNYWMAGAGGASATQYGSVWIFSD